MRTCGRRPCRYPDVKEVFEEPQAREGDGGGFALPPEIGDAQERDHEFAECAAENHDGVAEPAEEKVAAFVNDEINLIDDQKTGAVGGSVEKEEEIKDEPGDSGDVGYGLSIGKIIVA